MAHLERSTLRPKSEQFRVMPADGPFSAGADCSGLPEFSKKGVDFLVSRPHSRTVGLEELKGQC